MAPRCKLTKKNTITPDPRGGWLIDDTHRDNLDNCTFEAGATITLGTAEAQADTTPPTRHKRAQPQAPAQAPAPAPAPQLSLTPTATQAPAPAPAQSLQLPPELQELQELIGIYQSAQGLGPYAALAIVAAALWMKLQRAQKTPRDACRCDQCTAARHSAELHKHHHGHHQGHSHGHPRTQKTENENATCPTCDARRHEAADAADQSDFD